MLKGIDPLLSGELLAALDRLGHGETVLVVDRNFPAYAPGRPVVRIDADLVTAARAVLSVLPLDGEYAVARMQVGDDPALVLPQLAGVLELAIESSGESEPVPRFEFYVRAAEAALVVQTREAEPYANVIFTKGAIAD